MAAKKKDDPSKEDKDKGKKRTGSSGASGKKKATKSTKDKKAVKKKVEKPVVNREDDLGLEDIALQSLDEGPSEIVEEAPPVSAGTGASGEAAPGEDAPVKDTPPPVKKPVAEEKKEKKNRGLIWMVIIAVIIILLLLYFLVFTKNEASDPGSEPTPSETEQPLQKEAEPAEEVKAAEPETEVPPEEEPQVFTISQPQGRFYVVLGSFFDEDMAEDEARKIVASGRNAYILKPQGDLHFYRVGINESTDRSTINEVLAGLKESFGQEIWVLKY